jgi:hypothetical protein
MKQRDLALFARTGRKVRLTRRQPSEPRLNGYILGVSERLLLMHCFDDFEPDGYTICRIRDIIGVRHGPYEEWFDHMLRSESLVEGLKLWHRIDLSSWAATIRSVARHYRQMIVECEDVEEDVEDFYIGELTELRSRSIRFRDYDACGYWSLTPKSIAMAEITKIQFDTPYIKVFSKYTREGTPPEMPRDQ